MYRYLAIVWNPHSVDGKRTQEFFRAAVSKQPGWSVAYEGRGILALHKHRGQSTANTYVLHRHGGVVLGQLFEQRQQDYANAPDVSFDEAQAATIVRNGGQYLIDNYWGSYLALLYDETANQHHVLRDPVGTLPCYHLRHAGADIFFSHLEDCLHLAAPSLKINREHLARWLVFSSVRTNETGLDGITHLPRGERLTLSQTGEKRARLWDPAAIAANEEFRDPAEAARVLRATVQNSVDAWASRYRRIIHKVSGGLDSAIVAGCLAHAPSAPELTYVNMSIDNDLDQSFYFPGMEAKVAVKLRAIARSGDERFYARLVAQRWNTPLLETRRDTSMDLARLRQVPLSVAPAMYFTTMEMDDVEAELVSSHGTEAFFSGQAGDSVLLATLQPLGAMDYAYLHGLGGDLWQHIVTSSALSRDSLWSVIGKTVKHGLFRRPYTAPLRVRSRPTLLTQQLAQSLREEDFESTFARTARLSKLPPGKKNHVQGVAGAYYTFVFRAGELSDHIDPLNSQPVWEAMLRVPAYTALMGGINRGLARHAFADLLPAEIRRRQTKGTGSHFYQEVVRRNRHLLLERLAGGLLVRDGFLDRGKVLNCLSADEPAVMIPAASLMAYYAAEEWLQRMSSNPAESITSETTQSRETAAG